MINLYIKLKQDGKLKKDFPILDIGSGDGRMSKAFIESGFSVSLIDKNQNVLDLAKSNFGKFRNVSYISCDAENLQFPKHIVGGIIFSNVIPFLTLQSAKKVISNAWGSLVTGGFLYMTYFGQKDDWVDKRKDMLFLDEETAKSFVPTEPYFRSEDLGRGSTMGGDEKFWHIYHFLYIKS